MKDSLAHKMRTVSRMVARALEERIAAHGITSGMWYYLRVLWEHDGISQKELSERTGVVGPSTVGALARMAAMGLIERRKDASDRRVTNIYLTPQGRRLERRLVPIAVAVINDAVAGLPRAEIDRVKAALDHMKSNLEGKRNRSGQARARPLLLTPSSGRRRRTASDR